MKDKYVDRIDSLSKSTDSTLNYIKLKEETLSKANELLSMKEQELSNVTEYVYLLQTVIQALKFEISETEKEISLLKKETDTSKVYSDSIKSIQGLLHTGELNAASGVYSTQNVKSVVKKPEIDIQLQTFAGLQKDSEALTPREELEETDKLEADDTNKEGVAESKSEVEADDITVKDNKPVDSTVNNAGVLGSFLSVELAKDTKYLNMVKDCCVVPADNVSIWERRVLVKHYMESGMSQVNEIVTRFNAWADNVKAAPGTTSSISKDMLKIMNGEFVLTNKADNSNIMGVNLEFKPSSMLTCSEIGQLTETVRAMKNKYNGKTEYIKKYVSNYARTNLTNMSAYKIRAVDSFVDMQLKEN